MTIREKLEERERQTLSPMASLSAESRGPAVSGRTLSHPYRVPAGPGPDHPFQVLPAT